MMSKSSFDAEAVRALADILVQAGLTEVEVEADGVRIRVVKTPAPVMQTAQVSYAVPAAGTAPAAAAAVLAERDDADHPGAVASPMVGIVYLTPEPGAAPYVSVGQTVAIGQTLCVIEAMKTYNQIKATQAGTVLRVLVASTEPVEYGQPLMIVA